MNAGFDSNLLSSAHFQEALEFARRAFDVGSSDIAGTRGQGVDPPLPAARRGRSPNSPLGSRLPTEHFPIPRFARLRALAHQTRGNPLLARVKAYVAVDQGRKIADESRKYREVVAPFASLLSLNAHAGRSIARLRFSWLRREKRGSSAPFSLRRTLATISSLTCSHGQPRVMRWRLNGSWKSPVWRLPQIRIRRGPKMTAASAAHELFLEKHGIRGASAYSYSDLEGDFIDEATQATRLEFPGIRFGPQPASRRLKARRQLAGVPIPRRNPKGVSQKKSD